METPSLPEQIHVPVDASSTAETSILEGCSAKGSYHQATTRHQAASFEGQRDTDMSEAQQARPSHLC
jgi:hypothetical protein